MIAPRFLVSVDANVADIASGPRVRADDYRRRGCSRALARDHHVPLEGPSRVDKT